jgi:YD repeat-containing protein
MAHPCQIAVLFYAKVTMVEISPRTSPSSARNHVSVLLFAALWLANGVASAQDTTTYEEQYKRIKAPNAVTQYGPDLFGETVNLYTGALEFTHTDVSIRGNNKLPVAMGRRLRIDSQVLGGRAFGRWEMDIPHMHGIFPKTEGWQGSGANPMLRCAQYSMPPPVRGFLKSYWNPEEYWHGNYLYVPGAGDQRVLRRNNSTVATTGLSIQAAPAMTSKFWAISCVPTLDSDTTAGKTQGDGFVATSPDGVRYTFNWMVDFTASQLTKSNEDASTGRLARKEVWILPTLVTDRFGNWVRYTYDPARPRNLMTITSSETPARTISLTYYPADAKGDMQVQSVTDGTRTWTYGYHTDATTLSNLDNVVLPDGSRWNFAATDSLMPGTVLPGGGCDAPGAYVGTAYSGTMGHPSGAAASFTVTATTHGRSDVVRECPVGSPGALTPIYFNTFALTNKTISGLGLDSMAWNYDYGSPNGSYSPCNGCITSKTVTVTDPKGDATQHVFGNRYNVSEGRVEQLIVGGRTTTTTYQPFGAGPYPDTVGYADDVSGDAEMAARLAPARQRITTQQDATFTWEATEFDTLARATKSRRLSSLNPGRYETTAFADNFSLWVLGQVGSVTETSTGRETLRNTYDPATATLTSVARFGHLDARMVYYADGTLNVIRDGKSQPTSFSGYKRGVAQSIVHADGSSESALIDNIGNFTSVTNAASFTTTLGYTAGRLSSIGYPAGGPVAWNGTTITFAPVANTEYDLPAGHWRQTVTTGNASDVTYYDALWRPVYSYTADNANPGATSRLVKRQFDHNGHTTFESYPTRTYADIGPGVRTQYDALGRVIAVGADNGPQVLWTATSYLGGFQKAVTDPNGNVTTSSFHAFDEPSESAVAGIRAPLGVAVAINRDVFGKTQSITRSGGGQSATRSYVYDGFARLCKTIEPETGATVQDYDAANNVIWRASGNPLPSTINCDTANVAATRKVTFGYDAMNRLQSTAYADGSPAISRTFTADGLPSTITSGGAVWTNSYDNRRNNVSESLAYGGAAYSIGRSYDANGSLRLLTYPDTSSVDYAPNALGQPTMAGAFASAVRYHPNGAIAGFTYGNGIVRTLTQNARGLPDAARDAGVVNDKYTYDANGNVTSIDDLQEAISTHSMSYDGLDRLIGTVSAATFGTVTNTYDWLDNLTNVSVTQGPTARSTTHNFDAATNRLTSIASATGAYNLAYGYDSQGNITTRGNRSFVFDQGNRMTSATGTASYAYDGLGHRVSTVGTDGVNRVSVYTQGGQLLYLRATSVPLATGTKYIYLGRHQVAEVKAAGAN